MARRKCKILSIILLCSMLSLCGCSNSNDSKEKGASTSSIVSEVNEETKVSLSDVNVVSKEVSSDNEGVLEKEKQSEIITKAEQVRSNLKGLFTDSFSCSVLSEDTSHYGTCQFSWDYTLTKTLDKEYTFEVSNIKCISCDYPTMTSADAAKFINKKLQYITVEGSTYVDETDISIVYDNRYIGSKLEDSGDIQRCIFSQYVEKDTIVYDSVEGECLRVTHDALSSLSRYFSSKYIGVDQVFDTIVDTAEKQTDTDKHFKKEPYKYDLSFADDQWALFTDMVDTSSKVVITIKD